MNIRRIAGAAAVGASAGQSEHNDFTENDPVEVLYKGKGTKWFKGKISRLNRDGTYDIKYDDGDSETAALKVNIRRNPESSASVSTASAFTENEAVEVLYKGT